MGKAKLNEELLNSLIKNGYAVKDLGDGSWGWSKEGKKHISPIVLTILSDLLYGQKAPKGLEKTWKHFLNKAGFDEDGFPLQDD